MSRIRGKDTGPEVRLRKELWARGIRYRLKSRLPGKPDIVFPGARMVVFVDGCFWHGCPDHSQTPATNRSFWSKKLKRNVERDHEVTTRLEDLGWSVLRVWEHEVAGNVQGAVDRIFRGLANGLQPEK